MRTSTISRISVQRSGTSPVHSNGVVSGSCPTIGGAWRAKSEREQQGQATHGPGTSERGAS
jgi:hypothetical protein